MTKTRVIISATGNVIEVQQPAPIKQGSDGVDYIWLLCPFPSTAYTAQVAFKLPNNETTGYTGMSAQGTETVEGVTYYVYQYILPRVITQFYGKLQMSFYVIQSNTVQVSAIAYADIARSIYIGSSPLDETQYNELNGRLTVVEEDVVEIRTVADEAVTNSETAIQTANEAKQTANAVDAKATTALSNSEKALEQSNTAISETERLDQEIKDLALNEVHISQDLGNSTVLAVSQNTVTENINTINTELATKYSPTNPQPQTAYAVNINNGRNVFTSDLGVYWVPSQIGGDDTVLKVTTDTSWSFFGNYIDIYITGTGQYSRNPYGLTHLRVEGLSRDDEYRYSKLNTTPWYDADILIKKQESGELELYISFPTARTYRNGFSIMLVAAPLAFNAENYPKLVVEQGTFPFTAPNYIYNYTPAGVLNVSAAQGIQDNGNRVYSAINLPTKMAVENLDESNTCYGNSRSLLGYNYRGSQVEIVDTRFFNGMANGGLSNLQAKTISEQSAADASQYVRVYSPNNPITEEYDLTFTSVTLGYNAPLPTGIDLTKYKMAYMLVEVEKQIQLFNELIFTGVIGTYEGGESNEVVRFGTLTYFDTEVTPTDTVEQIKSAITVWHASIFKRQDNTLTVQVIPAGGKVPKITTGKLILQKK